VTKSTKKSKLHQKEKGSIYSRYELEPNEFYLLESNFFEDKKYYLDTYFSYWESDSLEFDPKIPFMLKKAYERGDGIFFVFYSVEHNKDVKLRYSIDYPISFSKFEKKLQSAESLPKGPKQKMSAKYNQQVINDVLAYARLFKWKENNTNYEVSVNQIYTGTNLNTCVSLCSKVLDIPESDVKQILKEYAGTL
jgi:hypothetical protein